MDCIHVAADTNRKQTHLADQHESSQVSNAPKPHFVHDDTVSECSLSSLDSGSSFNTNRTNFSFVEIGILFGGCCWLEESDSINICFCNARESAVPHQMILKMQSFVEHFSQSDVDMLLAHLTPFAREVCCSGAGCELMKDILRRASDSALSYFICSGALLDVACMYFGCRLVEFLLHLSKPTVLHMIVDNLFFDKNTFAFLSTNPMANYAVQQVVNEMSDSDFEISLGIMSECATVLSTDRHGAYVIQAVLKRACRMLEEGQEIGAVAAHVERILTCLIGMADRLIVNKYGNFSAQEMIHLLSLNSFLATKFATVLGQNLVKYAADHFGHSVVERFLERTDIHANTLLVKKFVELDEYDIAVCVDTKWGPFVVQKLWARATPELQQRMFQNLINAGKERIAQFMTTF